MRAIPRTMPSSCSCGAAQHSTAQQAQQAGAGAAVPAGAASDGRAAHRGQAGRRLGSARGADPCRPPPQVTPGKAVQYGTGIVLYDMAWYGMVQVLYRYGTVLPCLQVLRGGLRLRQAREAAVVERLPQPDLKLGLGQRHLLLGGTGSLGSNNFGLFCSALCPSTRLALRGAQLADCAGVPCVQP